MTEPYIIAPRRSGRADGLPADVVLRADRSVTLGTVGEDQMGWRAFRPVAARQVDYTFYLTRRAAAKALYDYFVEQRELDAQYCPDCRHPWSYATDGDCCMPVTPGTTLPISRNDQRREKCGCKSVQAK